MKGCPALLMQARPRLKLCFIGWADHVHLERWAGYFARLRHEVSLISFSGRGNYPEGVRQYTLGLCRRGMFWKKLRIAYLLWRIKPASMSIGRISRPTWARAGRDRSS